MKENELRILKRFGTNTSFPNPSKGQNTVPIAIFADAGMKTYHCQFTFVPGFLIGPLTLNSVFNVISRMSHKSKLPVPSIVAAKILAASE